MTGVCDFDFKLCDTIDRDEARDDYIVKVHPDVISRCGLGEQVSVEFTKEITKVDRCFHKEGGMGDRTFRIPARLVGDKRLAKPETASEEAPVTVDAGLDLTLRLALAIREDYLDERVDIHPIDLGLGKFARLRMTRFMGRRYMVGRVCSAAVIDCEKRVIRTSPSVLAMLCVEPGDHVQLEAISMDGDERKLSSTKVQIFETSQEDSAERLELERIQTHPLYIQPSEILGIDEDLPRVYIDKEVRDRLGIDVLDAVRIRRTISGAIKKDLAEYGLVTALSMLAVFEIAVADLSNMAKAGFVAIATIAALLLVIVRIRSKVKG